MNRVCSIFSQILQFFPRLQFEAAGKKHQAERHARGFSSWCQFVAMLFCQLGHAQTLREITGGLAACEGKLRHLGISEPPKRTTLSYANEHRPWQLYQSIFQQLLARCQGEAARHRRKFRFKHKLLSLTRQKVQFVTRLKDTAAYGVVEQRPVPAGSDILRDEVILLVSQQEMGPEALLRRIEVWVEEKQQTMVFVTNNRKQAASTIAAIYRERWQIELFFKALKQSLRVKTFVGTSENAVQTQIWTAAQAAVIRLPRSVRLARRSVSSAAGAGVRAGVIGQQIHSGTRREAENEAIDPSNLDSTALRN